MNAVEVLAIIQEKYRLKEIHSKLVHGQILEQIKAMKKAGVTSLGKLELYLNCCCNKGGKK